MMISNSHFNDQNDVVNVVDTVDVIDICVMKAVPSALSTAQKDEILTFR